MPVKIFASYAPKDEVLVADLQNHLHPLLTELGRKGLIEARYDHRISAGEEWEREIDKQLNTADIILLFISIDFITLNYCYSKEMQRAIERHKRGDARVIPVILRPCGWEETPFGKLQALPTNAKPITQWSSRGEAYEDVIVGIRKTIEELLAIEFSIEQGDITSFNADVVALKYAQEFFGVDALIARNLGTVGIAKANLRPAIGDYRYVETQHCINAHHALFVGVPFLTKFGYQQM